MATLIWFGVHKNGQTLVVTIEVRCANCGMSKLDVQQENLWRANNGRQQQPTCC